MKNVHLTTITSDNEEKISKMISDIMKKTLPILMTTEKIGNITCIHMLTRYHFDISEIEGCHVKSELAEINLATKYITKNLKANLIKSGGNQ